MKQSSFTAVKLRNFLIGLIIILIASAGVGFYFAQSWLHDLAVTVSRSVADSQKTDTSVKSIDKVQQELISQQDVVAKINNLFTAASTYQTDAVKDLTAYAAATGITISNFAFPAVASTATSGSTPKTQITVTLVSPVSYTSLLKFVTIIENSLPKMQITGITISGASGNDAVKIDQLTVAVYTR